MKRLICLLICLCLMLALGSTSVYAGGVTGEDTDISIPLYQPGDVNGNRAINAEDAALLLKYAAGWSVSINKSPSDVNNDGVVDGLDAALLLQKVAGWNVTLK